MKKIPLLVLLIAFFLSYDATAQVGIPQAAAQQTIVVDADLLEKYIKAAIEYYPHIKVLQLREKSAQTNIGSSAWSYLDIFNGSYIFRPNNATAIASPGLTANPYSVNGFQFGVNFDLGTFLEKPYTAKKARIDYDATKYETQEAISLMVLDVKKRYYTLVQANAVLRDLIQNVEDARVIAENIRIRYEKAEAGATLDIYEQSRLSFTAANVAKIQGEVNVLEAQDSLEQLIGKKLSEIK